MLYVFTGGDGIAVRSRVRAFLDSFEEQSVQIERIDAQGCTLDFLRERVQSQSLFLQAGTPEVVVLDSPGERTEALEAVCVLASALADSSHIFVLIEGVLAAAAAKELKLHATEYHEIRGETVERFNVFALADAFSRRDKKSLWVLLLRAQQAGLSSEEIIGTLFWQIKTMRLALRTKSADEAGLKPFVYSKAKRAMEKFKDGELDEHSRALVCLYHDAHLGTVDIDLALERWVLGI